MFLRNKRLLWLVMVAALVLIPVLVCAEPPGHQQPPGQFQPGHQPPGHQPPGHQPPGPQHRTVEVGIRLAGFSPATVFIRPGDRVTWVNLTRIRQQLVFRHMRSPVLPRGARWTETFWREGEFPYRLAIAPRVTGKIIVRNIHHR